MVIIMRYAVLPEDEGQSCFVKMVSTREEAEEWIKNQEGEYFGPNDYFIVG